MGRLATRTSNRWRSLASFSLGTKRKLLIFMEDAPRVLGEIGFHPRYSPQRKSLFR